MHALLYRSRARPGLLADDLNDIIETAEARNRRLGVTGLLLHGRMEALPGVAGEFVQWLEGPEEAVETLFGNIERDGRHTGIEVLGRGPLAQLAAEAHVGARGERLFPAWSLGLVRLAELPATLSGFLRFVAEWDGDRLAAVA
jgi:hypothetical protein